MPAARDVLSVPGIQVVRTECEPVTVELLGGKMSARGRNQTAKKLLEKLANATNDWTAGLGFRAPAAYP